MRDSLYIGEKLEYHTTELMPEEKDECSVNAYLYEVANIDETLNGTNIDTSPKVIMKAVFSGAAVKTDYVNVEILFTDTGNGTYDSKKLYKLAIVCCYSKKGDQLMGAPGSVLCMKYFEVVAW